MASGPELVGRLGLDKSNYTRGLGEAERDFSKFTAATARGAKGVTDQLGQLNYKLTGAREILHGFGYALVFDKFIAGFKEVSEWAKKFGDQTDDNIRAAGRWGDAWKGAIDSAKEKGASFLGFLAQAGEYAGGLLKGESPDQVDADAASDDAASQAEKARDEAFKANDPKKVAALREDNAKKEAALAEKSMTLAQRKADLDKRTGTLLVEQANLATGELEKQETLKGKILDLELERKNVVAEIAKVTADSQHKQLEEVAEIAGAESRAATALAAQKERELAHIADLEKDAAAKKADKSKLTLGELANLDIFQSGTSVAAGQQGAQAREAIDLQNKANQARLSGDVTGAEAFSSQADEITKALHAPGGLLRSTDHPDDDTSKQLEAANKTLDEINTKLAGKFTAEA